jgi:hypothetical protein
LAKSKNYETPHYAVISTEKKKIKFRSFSYYLAISPTADAAGCTMTWLKEAHLS